MSSKPLFVFALAVMLSTASVAHAQAGPYKVLKIQLVGGDGGFDYVTADADGRNLYVARSGPAGHIGVFNLDTLAQVGDIPGASAHGAAVEHRNRPRLRNIQAGHHVRLKDLCHPEEDRRRGQPRRLP